MVLGGFLVVPPMDAPRAAADPADVQQIIDDLEATSRDVEAHNEQIEATQVTLEDEERRVEEHQARRAEARAHAEALKACLLYTSDAADE